MRFKIFFCLFMLSGLSLINIANGQDKTYTISGVVLDSTTNTPIANAYVTTANQTVRADVKGRYVLKNVPAGKTALVAMHYDYISSEPKQIYVTSDAVINLYINNVLMLDEIVVTGTRTPKNIKDIPVITQVITAKQITERGINDVKDLLMQEVPGLNFQEVGFGTAIDIQGLSSNHVLFLIDGERMAGENGGNIDYSRINLYDIDRIEIVKGASSSLYGSQAMGGVVNIISKQARSKVDVNVNVRYAGLNQRNFDNVSKDDAQYVYQSKLDIQNINANVNVGFNLGRLKMNTDVSYKGFDGYQLYDTESVVKYFPKYDLTITEPIGETPTNISGYEDIQIAHRMSYKISDKISVKLNGRYYHLNKHDFLPNNIYDNTESFTYGASVLYDINEKSKLNFSYSADDYARYDKYELIEGKALNYKNNIIQPRVIHNHTFNENHTLSSGVEFYQESLYGDQFSGSNSVYSSKLQWAATMYVQEDWTVNEKLSLILGVRADYHHEYGFNPVPKVSAMYKLSPFSLRFNYAQGFRTPTLKELYMDWDHLGMFWIYGNPDLKPERNNYVSISQEYNSEWLDFSTNFYGNWFTNKIEGLWTDDQTQLHYTNLGKTRLLGAEMMAKLKVKRYLNIMANYNYVNVSESEGVQLSSTAPHSGNIRVEGYINRNRDYATTLNFTASIIGGKSFDVLDEIEVDGKTVEAYYRANIAAYTICNFTVSQQITPMMKLIIGVNNIFDYKAPIVTFNSSTSPGRIFHATLNFKINKR